MKKYSYEDLETYKENLPSLIIGFNQALDIGNYNKAISNSKELYKMLMNSGACIKFLLDEMSVKNDIEIDMYISSVFKNLTRIGHIKSFIIYILHLSGKFEETYNCDWTNEMELFKEGKIKMEEIQLYFASMLKDIKKKESNFYEDIFLVS